MGGKALEQIAAKPNEAANLRNEARRNFEDASKNFAVAVEALAAKAKTLPATITAAESLDLEWLARARCDYCEMLLRLDKFREAAEVAKVVLTEKPMEGSRFRALALYHLGYASFAMREYLAAGRALSQLAPFQQEFGVHARYLLARTHHLSEERPEAAAQYKALVADYQQQKKAAIEAMRNPNALRPDDRARFEVLAKDPPPDYVLRATFYTALLAAEEGRYGEALEGFSGLLQQYPKNPLAEEAQLRQGYCQLQLRNYPEAIKALQPLQNHPQLADLAMWWQAKAQIGAADPANAQAYEQALRSAMELLNRAADKAGEYGRADPAAQIRRGDILLELADTQQLARQYKEAAATYQKALSENNNPDRAEEAAQRQATALHLAGQYKESDDLCQKFAQTYPKSTLLAIVWFRAAENARMIALAAANDANMRSRRAEVAKMFAEAIQRYQRLLGKHPEFAYVSLARYGLATSHYHLGQYVETIAALEAIPETDRNGELGVVPYLIADCYIRTLPAETDDALEAAQLLDKAEQAAKLLERFVGAQPKSPQAPDALLKLGYCYQRIGAVLADADARQKTLTAARDAYERLQREYGNSTSQPAAVFERAKCLALLGDANGAINELGRFQSDPLKNTAIAPLALIRYATLLRSQNRAADAVKALAQCRAQYEGTLQNDPARADWVPLLLYEHALAVKESGKPAEARPMFEALAKQFAGRPEAANATWRAGQCRREELLAVLIASREAVARPGVRPEQIVAATKAIEDSLVGLRQTADSFQAETAKLTQSAAGSEAHLRMLYETAWCYRTLAEAEIEAARQKLQSQALEKILANLKKTSPSQPTPALNPPELPLAAVPVQPSEKAARALYAALIAAAREVPLTARARLELAEMLAQRGENETAIDVLASALEGSPPLDLAERIRLRLAACLLAKGDGKAALTQIQPVARNPKSALLGEARYLAGEAYILGKDFNSATEQLLPFRDQDPFRNMAAVCDRALLRLGHACAQAQKWDDSRRAYETLVQRFPQSPWVHEARYGMGWAWQNQNQHDNAINAYNEVVRGTAAEVAARAQLQIGVCRLAQKRFPDAAKELLVVPFTYEYPEHSAAALCEAGLAYVEMKQPAEAARLWQGVVKDYASSKWADVAKQRLTSIQ